MVYIESMIEKKIELQKIINNTLLDKTIDLISPADLQEIDKELSGLEDILINLFSTKGGVKI